MYKAGYGDGACVACAGGLPSPAGSVGPSACACGAGATRNGSACVACAPGTYKATDGDGACAPCGAGSLSPAGSVSPAACVCSAGFRALA